MSKDKEVVEDKPIEFDVMPGADKDSEVFEQLDLSFPEVEEPKAEDTAEESEETVAEDTNTEEDTADSAVPSREDASSTEETEEVEETVAEEPEVEETVAEEPKEEPKKPMVPKSRLDEVLTKQKALQKQLDDLKAAQKPAEDAPEEYDFSAKEMEYQNAVLDGEAEKAASLRAEIRKAERAQIEYEMNQKMTDAVSQNQMATALQQAASTLEAEFPVFDQKSDQYNEAMTNEVIDLRDAFIVKGENAVAALSKAAKYVINEYGLVDNTPTTPALASEAAPKKNIDEVSKKRAEVSRKLKVADSQPPELAGEGAATRGEKAIDLSSLSEEEFDALPEATLKRLRGDIV